MLGAHPRKSPSLLRGALTWRAGLAGAVPGVLDDLDGLGLRALLAFSSDVGNALVFFKRFEARADDVGVMGKQILAAGFGLDEAVALFVVEPLYDTKFS